MHYIDYAVLVGFMLWMLGVGWIFSKQMKKASDMFAAGGQSPWWVSGLSGFMTIFSAGTFVVWGGIAYQLGLVAVSILMVIGLSLIPVGWYIAGYWRKTGITTPTEFLRIRFNESVVQAYTWLGIAYRSIGLGVGLYSLALMLSVLVPLEEGAPFRDAQTGNLSVAWSILLWGAVVIIYTMAGGLWAVLMTDVIQCIVLCLVVLVAVPLSINAVGGTEQLWIGAPKNFFSPATAEFSYTFLFLWFWLGVFRYAADWGFVQRYICVPTPRDARKVAYLMGILYLVSPIFWMLPAMAYRLITPDADPEEAYMLICQKVLPTGMLGIMVAAMFSATASMVSSLLNVVAGIFTCDVYKTLINPNASERRIVLVGRLATLGYGILIILIALSVPYLGGARELVMILLAPLLGPLMLPNVWGLFSRRIGSKAVWTVLGICTPLGIIVKVAPAFHDWLTQRFSIRSYSALKASIDWIADNPRIVDMILGLLIPLAILIVAELFLRRNEIDAGWQRLQAACENYQERPVAAVESRLPSQVLAASFGMLTILMIGVTIVASEERITLTIFSIMLCLATAAMTWMGFRPRKKAA